MRSIWVTIPSDWTPWQGDVHYMQTHGPNKNKGNTFFYLQNYKFCAYTNFATKNKSFGRTRTFKNRSKIKQIAFIQKLHVEIPWIQQGSLVPKTSIISTRPYLDFIFQNVKELNFYQITIFVLWIIILIKNLQKNYFLNKTKFLKNQFSYYYISKRFFD